MKNKRVLSLLLSLCLLFGTWVVGASATETETKILYVEGEVLRIEAEGYFLQDDFYYFSGNYVIANSPIGLVFGGQDGCTYNITIHNVNCYAGSYTPIYFTNSNTTVNLTVYGLFYTHSQNFAVAGEEGTTNNQIKVTVVDEGGLYWNVNQGEVIGSGVSVTDANGNPLTNKSERPDVFLVGDGIPHSLGTIKGETGCEFLCEECDLLNGVQAPHTPDEGGTYVNDDECQRFCSICEQSYLIGHQYGGYRYVADVICGEYCANCDEIYYDGYDHEYAYDPAEGGHTMYCSDCDYVWSEIFPHNMSYEWKDAQTCRLTCIDCGYTDEEGQPHSYESGNYSAQTADGCAPACDNCGGYDADDLTLLVPHDYAQAEYYDAETCYRCCSRCGWAEQDENGFVITMPHNLGDSQFVAQTTQREEHQKVACSLCGYATMEFNKEKSIVIDMPTVEASEMGGLVVYRNGKLWKHVSNVLQDREALPFDKNSSYVFKLINTQVPETSLAIWIPGMEEPLFQSEDLEEDGYGIYDTLASYNLADYTALQAALDAVPETMSTYTEASALAVADAVKGIERMLPASAQNKVDQMTQAVNKAVAGLQERGPTDPVHGVIHLKNTCVAIYPDCYTMYDGISWEELYTVEYQGEYVLFGSQALETQEYSCGAFWVYEGAETNIDLINVWSVGTNATAGLYNQSSANITLYGNNVIADGSLEITEYAGIGVYEESSLSINGDGSLLALGQDNCAGIGGSYSSTEFVDAGNIAISGGTVFALSSGDAAGIGGGYKGAAGNITISGGTVYAACLHDDGPGIGTGEDGKGGKVTILDSYVTAVSFDDDGAGIGSGDTGHIDSITISGGVVIAGSNDGAAIGGGSDANGYGGKILIQSTAMVIPHIDHDANEYFIGNGSSNSKGLSTDNFVQIQGGIVVTNGTKGIYPLDTENSLLNISGVSISAPEGFETQGFSIVLDGGAIVPMDPVNGKVTVYCASVAYTVMGDVSKDNKINAQDALMALQIAVGKILPTSLQKGAADVNQSNAVDAVDALEILRKSVKKPTCF